MERPSAIGTAAVIQLISGIVNVFIMTPAVYFGASFVCGLLSAAVTLGTCPFGAFCGMAGCFLIPMGILEIIAGALGLSGNGGGSFPRIVGWIEIASLFFGGFTSFVAGCIVVYMTGSPEVKGWIAQQSQPR